MNHPSQNNNVGSTNDQPGILHSTIFEWDQLQHISSPHGEFRAMADAPSPPFERVEMHATTLKPGLTSHAPHRHPQEEVLLIKEGFVEAWINGRTERVGAGSMIFFASFDLHGLTNVGHVPAAYYVINFYTASEEALNKIDPSMQTQVNRYPSTVIDWAKTDPISTPTGRSRTLASSPTSTLGRFEVKAHTIDVGANGTTFAPAHGAQVVIVKEGLLEIIAGGTVNHISAGSLAYIASGEPYSIRNRGARPATYFIFSFSPLASSENPA